jgi:hypothetical protein
MDEVTCQSGRLTESPGISGTLAAPARLTPVQWII